jgi:hypothetical protein
MKLDDAQREKVTQWIEEGLKLSEIQDKLSKEFGLRMTYMEARFLMDDLGVKLKDKPKEAPAPEIGKAAKPGQPPPGAKPVAGKPLQEEPPAAGGVLVTVDQITRPGALASGKVNFTDGKSAEWYLDQMGRLGLVPKEQGYKPSEEDLMDFQTELQNELAKLGF